MTPIDAPRASRESQQASRESQTFACHIHPVCRSLEAINEGSSQEGHPVIKNCLNLNLI
jgi:hypothetical protein